ncbi:hypothetical protein LguiA_029050 [Lonicera macranthoides]
MLNMGIGSGLSSYGFGFSKSSFPHFLRLVKRESHSFFLPLSSSLNGRVYKLRSTM